MSKLLLRKNRGFTLLELLLVIIILAVLASLGIGFYQQRSTDEKLTKTAQQMQQILQAASAYYVDNSCWPNSPACAANPISFNQYLPVASLTNPWGNAYKFQAEPTFGKKFQVYSGALPNPQNKTPNPFVARLQSLLPSAAIDPANANQVFSEIVIPGKQLPIVGKYVIQHIGGSSIMHNGDTGGQNPASPFQFSCPKGWTAGALALPVYIAPDDWKGEGILCGAGPGSNQISVIYAYGLNCPAYAANSYQCSYTTQYWSQRYTKTGAASCGWRQVNTGDIAFSEIGYCINPKSSEGNNTQPQMLY